MALLIDLSLVYRILSCFICTLPARRHLELFSVEEPVDAVMPKIEAVATARISNAIRQSGLVSADKPAA